MAGRVRAGGRVSLNCIWSVLAAQRQSVSMEEHRQSGLNRLAHVFPRVLRRVLNDDDVHSVHVLQDPRFSVVAASTRNQPSAFDARQIF